MKAMNAEQMIMERMLKRGVSQRAIDFFINAYRTIQATQKKPLWESIVPVAGDTVVPVPMQGSDEYDELEKIGQSHLEKCVVIKLNGGRSTSLGGGAAPKCTIEAKDGRSFLDINLKQLISANDREEIEMPLILMNSFFTDGVTMELVGDTPLLLMNFLQNEFPRIQEKDLLPLTSGTDDDWCPAGHGDFYMSFADSGLLDGLLQLGVRYAFISNIDNLSATVSPVILGQMVNGGHDFIMEVTRKTESDVKGGAPVSRNGRLSLLEIAQVPDEHLDDFQDISTFQYFNTNNLWVDLQALKRLLESDGLNLPVIKNKKRVLDTDVIQVETAMGAALGCFSRPGLIEVPRSRFSPVKKMSDLLELQTDSYIMTDDFQIVTNPNLSGSLPGELADK